MEINKVKNALTRFLCGVALCTVALSANALTITEDIGINGESLLSGGVLTLSSQDIKYGTIDGNDLSLAPWSATMRSVTVPMGIGSSVSSLWTITDMATTYNFDLDSVEYFTDTGVAGRARTITFGGVGTLTDGSGNAVAAYFALSTDMRLINGSWKGTNSTITFSAVPLPAAGWLFGSALVGVGALSRRKTGQKESQSLAA